MDEKEQKIGKENNQNQCTEATTILQLVFICRSTLKKKKIKKKRNQTRTAKFQLELNKRCVYIPNEQISERRSKKRDSSPTKSISSILIAEHLKRCKVNC